MSQGYMSQGYMSQGYMSQGYMSQGCMSQGCMSPGVDTCPVPCCYPSYAKQDEIFGCTGNTSVAHKEVALLVMQPHAC